MGRFFAWYFNSSLIELDLFLTDGGLVHRQSEIERIIDRRLSSNRPIFVEGVKVLAVLEAVGKAHDFLLYVRNPKHPRGFGFGVELDEYESNYKPEGRADFVMDCESDS